MFFRIKKIKGKEYAYVVENEWKPTAKSVGTLRGGDMASESLREPRMSQPRGSRQKVKGYLGRVYRFDLKNDVGFLEYFNIRDAGDYISNNDDRKIMTDLAEWELFKFSVKKDEFLIDLNSAKIQKKKKNAVLLVNEGFMCSLTLKNLLEFKPEDEQSDGYRLAKAFVEAGIKVPQEIFVGIFSRLHKTKDNQRGDFTW